MSQVKIYDLQGQEKGKIKLNKAVFGLEKNDQLIHQAVVCVLANNRQANAHTKTRGEIAGGGAKPWKQKGTGRARAGSSRSPIWSGGGTVFGPRNDRNYSQKLNKKMRRKALLMTLSDKVSNKKLVILDSVAIDEPKTKLVVTALDVLPTSDGTVLAILPNHEENFELASSNVPYIKTIKLDSINIVDVLKYDYILTTEAGIKKIEETFTSEITDHEDEDKKENKEEKPAEVEQAKE